MQGAPAGVALFDLGTAAEAVREDQCAGGDVPYGGQHPLLRHRHGQVVMALFEAEVAGQTAAAGIQDARVDPGAPHQFTVGVVLRHRVLVAVGLHRGRPGEGRGLPAFGCVVE